MPELITVDTAWFDLIRAAAWSLLLWTSGIALWRWLEPRTHARLPWGAAFALGAALAVPILYLAAAVGYLSPVAWAYGILGCATLIFGIKQRGMPRLAVTPRQWKWPEIVLAGLSFTGWAIAFTLCAKPILSYDILSYHLPIAHALRDPGGWSYLSGNYYSRLPLAAFTLYGPALSDRASTLDDPGVRVFLWFAMIAGSLISGRIAGHLGARRPGRWLATLLYSWHPMVWGGLINAHSDLLTALFALASVERLLVASGRSRDRKLWGIAAGFLAGTAVAVKFSAVGIFAVPFVIGGVWLAFCKYPAPSGNRAFKFAIILSCGILVGFGLWGVRSTVVGGNPLHPFVGVAPGWSAEQSQFLVEQHHPQGVFSGGYWSSFFGKIDVFDYSLRLTPSNEETGEAGLLFPVILLLWAGALVYRQSRKRSIWLLGVCGLGYAAWHLVGLAPARFVLPVVALGWIVAAAWTFPRRGATPIHRCGAGVALFALAMTILTRWVGFYDLGFHAEDWKRDHQIPEELLLAAHGLPPEGRILLLFENRGRWFPSNQESATVWDVVPWGDDLKASNSGLDFANRLQARGVTHVFVNEFEWNRLVIFYGGMKTPPAMGTMGLNGDRALVENALRSYPSFKFSGFGEKEYRVLLEFLVLTRSQAAKTSPAGPVAEMWLAPLSATEKSRNGPETDR